MKVLPQLHSFTKPLTWCYFSITFQSFNKLFYKKKSTFPYIRVKFAHLISPDKFLTLN